MGSQYSYEWIVSSVCHYAYIIPRGAGGGVAASLDTVENFLDILCIYKNTGTELQSI